MNQNNIFSLYELKTQQSDCIKRYQPLQTSDPASSRIHSFLTTFCAVPMDHLTYPSSLVQDYRRNSEPGPLYLS